jgi:predicted phage-related endonuclease
MDQADEPTEAMRIGNRLEGPLVDFACEELGVEAVRNQYRVEVGNGGVCAANLDALVTAKPWAIEAKYVGPQHADAWGEAGTDQVPDHVNVQCQHQMHVAELDTVWVAAAIARYQLEWRLYRVPRHDALIRAMVDWELAFWAEHVLPGIPPTDEPPPSEILKAIRRQPASVTPLDEAAANLAAEWDTARTTRATAEALEEDAKRRLIAALGECEAGLLPDGRLVTYLSQRGAPRFDGKRFKAKHAELWEQFSEETSHRVLRIKKNGGKKE